MDLCSSLDDCEGHMKTKLIYGIKKEDSLCLRTVVVLLKKTQNVK